MHSEERSLRSDLGNDFTVLSPFVTSQMKDSLPVMTCESSPRFPIERLLAKPENRRTLSHVMEDTDDSMQTSDHNIKIRGSATSSSGSSVSPSSPNLYNFHRTSKNIRKQRARNSSLFTIDSILGQDKKATPCDDIHQSSAPTNDHIGAVRSSIEISSTYVNVWIYI